ncbi:hypothetical protein [Fodinibius halophilus]|uniref:Uncharacterized protein n=1 Tax=Fodinibius halophilus TaxID=1736908 RepID=A0A6M1T5W3_9BACT|nr:hypothetical protein [Fodinibius halophilus]NGP89507.1 hypothetical protein [Fodinibius halophilus]
MTPFEYIFPLVSVIIGLAVADLAKSVHRLLRNRKKVYWDWLPLTTALLVLLTVLNVWWGFYSLRDETYYQNLIGFIPLVTQLILLFFVSAAVLPDKIQKEGLNLQRFYKKNSPYFWSLYAAFIFVIITQQSIYLIIAGIDPLTSIIDQIPNILIFSVFICLVFIRSRLFHAVVVIALFLLFITKWAGMNLGAM